MKDESRKAEGGRLKAEIIFFLPSAFRLRLPSAFRHGILQAEGLKQLSPGQAGLAGATLGIGSPHPILFSA
jgi:hypothetical protein